jgi:outer membrane lipoprotein SlyB
VVCAVCGTVESVTPIQREAAAGSGVGAVAGAVLGGLLGNQVGGGDGKTIATVIGVLGGGWAGNTVEKRMKKETVYQVEVRMEDGSTRSVEQSSPAAVGSRVTVEGNVMGPAPEGPVPGAHTAN